MRGQNRAWVMAIYRVGFFSFPLLRQPRGEGALSAQPRLKHFRPSRLESAHTQLPCLKMLVMAHWQAHAHILCPAPAPSTLVPVRRPAPESISRAPSHLVRHSPSALPRIAGIQKVLGGAVQPGVRGMLKDLLRLIWGAPNCKLQIWGDVPLLHVPWLRRSCVCPG